jgi:hypothetical protein
MVKLNKFLQFRLVNGSREKRKKLELKARDAIAPNSTSLIPIS